MSSKVNPKAKPAETPAPAPDKPKLILPEIAVNGPVESVQHANGADGATGDAQSGPAESHVTKIEPAACANCIFFVKTGEGTIQTREVDVGTCHARAPSPILVGISQSPITGQGRPMVDGYFPATNGEQWCGDWRSRKRETMN